MKTPDEVLLYLRDSLTELAGEEVELSGREVADAYTKAAEMVEQERERLAAGGGRSVVVNIRTSTWEEECNRAVGILARETMHTTRWVGIMDLVYAIQHIRSQTEDHLAEMEHLCGGDKTGATMVVPEGGDEQPEDVGSG